MIDLAPIHLETVKRILAAKVPECEVRAFGSRVTWTAKDYSDLDLAVVGTRALEADTLRHLREAFEESDLPYRVDVLDWHTIDESFRKVIERSFEVIQRGEGESGGRAGEWRETSLGEFVRLQRGHDLPEADRRSGVVPIMGSAGHNGFHNTAIAKGPGVVIGRSGVGSMGVVSYSAADYWPHNTVLYVTDFLGNDERFTYYFLRHLNLRRFDSGSAQASLNRNYIYPLRVRTPDPAEQRAIAHILGTLDDKIELNRRMNETLEAIARALFKSWFESLEPVRSKASDLIRDGVLEIGDGYRAKNSELGEPGLPFIRAGNLSNGFDTCAAEVLREDSVAKAGRKLSWPGDVAFTSKGTVGRIAFVTKSTQPFVYSPQVCYWRSLDHKRLHPAILYCWMKSEDSKLQVDAVAGQTDMAPYVSLRDQRAMEVPVFPEAQEALARRLETFLARQNHAAKESKTLAALRDTLLPKLISGELRMKDAERLLERVR